MLAHITFPPPPPLLPFQRDVVLIRDARMQRLIGAELEPITPLVHKVRMRMRVRHRLSTFLYPRSSEAISSPNIANVASSHRITQIRALIKEQNTSIIIVVGGCGGYLDVADLVLQMEHYRSVPSFYPFSLLSSVFSQSSSSY